MTRKREKLQAYFAGLFDGEGSVGIYLQKRYGSARLALHVTMTEPLGVLLLSREYPEALLYKKELSGNKRAQYVFELQMWQCYKFLREIKPYTIVKREQISLALSFLVHRRKAREAGEYHHSSECEHCKWFVKKIKEKKIPQNGVNSVNAWPERSREYRAKLEEVEQDVRELLERVETRLSESDEAISAPEKDIVHTKV